MPKDFKIGMFVGLVVVIGATLWLSMRPGLSTRASMLGPDNSGAGQENIEQPVFELNRPDSSSAEAEIESKEAKDVGAPRYHIVQNGDTLSGISYQYYGSENKWQKILDANRNIIHDVRNLKPGTKLIIPE
jgi:nucleoid-associated protein YgaU